MVLLVNPFLRNLHHPYTDYRYCHCCIEGHSRSNIIHVSSHGADNDTALLLTGLSTSKDSLYIKDSLVGGDVKR